MSDHDDPKKEEPQAPEPPRTVPADPGATVAWNPEDVPGLLDETPDAAPAPPAATPDSGATIAWDPNDVPGLGGGDETPPAEPPPAVTPPAAAGAGATMAWNPEDIAAAAGGDAPPAAEADSPGDEEEEDPLVGTMLKDKWRVIKKLGAGAFGTVYKVEDVAGGWIEALKILGVDRLTGAEGENMKKRFLREAQIMKRLGKESKHIVGLSTYEEDIDAGLIYLVMEYVEGQPLSEVVKKDGPLSVERTIKIALQVCDALIAAHAEPVVHRDMKLENIMMTVDRSGDEIAKVLDFGIAKIAEKETDSRLTTVGTLGTPGYAAPEQLRAEPVDGRTDLFAFGVILYELLTGHDPWLGNAAHTSTTQIYELMVATERGEVRAWDDTGVDVPPAMQNVVMKLLRREADQRFQSAQELRDALLRVSEGAAVEDAGSLRILTDTPGVKVEIRSGRSVVAEGPTPCVANAVTAGTYKVRVIDDRYEPLETTVTLDAGAIEDLTLVTTARATGVAASARRSPALVAAVVLVILVGAGAAFVQPWGRTLDLDGLEAKAGSVASAWLTEAGITGTLSIGPIPAPFSVPLEAPMKAEAVTRLRSAGLTVDTGWEVARLVGLAGEAQSRLRYFGTAGDDVRSYADQLTTLDPDSEIAQSLYLKVAERMAWDAAAAAQDGEADRAEQLVRECLALVPGHAGCAAAASDD